MSTAAVPTRHYIEDLKPGMSESYVRTVTEEAIQKFGEVSGDFNPVHFDDEYAKSTIFRGRIAHGLLTAGYISTVLGTKLPGAGAIFMGATIRFKAPVRIGDSVTATCTVREVIAEKKRVICDCICKVGENAVIEAEATLLVPSRPE
nr:MAG: MaoC family dehydratase [Hyphomicrobiales bacterium]